MNHLIALIIALIIPLTASAKMEIWKCFTTDTDRFLGYYKVNVYEKPHVWKRKKGSWHPETPKNIKLNYEPSQQNLSGISKDGWIYVVDLLLRDIYFYESSNDTGGDYNSLYSCRVVKDYETAP
tara:strand:- start:45 stop:416 length:372 start_codon:yes stop_codon:yes gene_type:complete